MVGESVGLLLTLLRLLLLFLVDEDGLESSLGLIGGINGVQIRKRVKTMLVAIGMNVIGRMLVAVIVTNVMIGWIRGLKTAHALGGRCRVVMVLLLLRRLGGAGVALLTVTLLTVGR